MKKLKLNQTPSQKVYLFSDPHYSHVNICGGTTKWVEFPTPYKEWEQKDEKGLIKFCLDNGVRPFSSLSKMNDTIVNNINSVVRENDIVICLGDWAFGEQENIRIFRNRIVCKNVHLVYGNHDKHIEEYKNGYQSLFSSVGYYKEIYIDGNMVCLFHYKQQIWNKSHREAYHLYGHSHASAEHIETGRSMDVGIDNAYRLTGEYRPFSWDEVHRLLKDRPHKVIDHHGSREGQE